MRNKYLAVLVTVAITALVFGPTSCKKATPKPWDSQQFVGHYTGNQTCLLTGASTDSLTITATTDSTIAITNLYGLQKTLSGKVSNDTCTIPPQICDTVILQGQFIVSSGTLQLSIIASSFGREDKCNAMLLKQ